MTNIFISYSRRNKDFTQQLVEALLAANREVWADWQNIPAASDWDAEIKEGIRNTESVLFVLSPEWLKSAECRKELDYALLMGKRLITILHQPIEYNDLPADLKKINWIDMSDPAHFDSRFQTVCTALDTDLDWIKAHTRIQVRAVEWDKKNRDASFALRGKDLTDGEQFLAGAANKNPAPTPLQSDYILASRKDATRRQRMTLGGVTVALVVSIVLGVLAWFQRQAAVAAEATAVVERDRAVVAQNTAVAAEATAVANEQEAKRQATISRAGELAALALSKKDTNFNLALLLGLEGFEKFDNSRTRGTLLTLSNSHSELQSYLSGHTSWVYSVAFSPDGKYLASGSADNSIIIWDVQNASTPFRLARIEGNSGSVRSLAFDPDGKRLASGNDDGTVSLWDISDPTTPSELAILEGHSDMVNSVAVSPNGKLLASGSADTTIILWDISNTTTPSILSTLIKHSDSVTSVTFSPDGTELASGSGDATIVLWNMQDPANPFEIATLEAHTWVVRSVAFSPDGKQLASAGQDRQIILWDVTQPAAPFVISTMFGHTNWVQSITFTPDGKQLISGSDDTSIVVWDISNPTVPSKLSTLSGQSKGIKSIAISPDGSPLASGSDDTTVVLRALIRPLPPSQLSTSISNADWVASVIFSPDGKQLASGNGDNTITLWDLHESTAPPSELSTLEGHTDVVYSITYSPTAGELASGSDDGTVILWDVSDPTAPSILSTLRGHNEMVESVAFHPDAKILASGSYDSSIILWDIQNPASPSQLSNLPQSTFVTCIAFSPDGKYLAVGLADHTIILFDVSNAAAPSKLLTLYGHSDWVRSIAFSPDGTRLASASDDTTIILWDVSNPATSFKISTLSGHINWVHSVTFSPDGKQLASGSDDTTIIVWDISDPTIPAQLFSALTGFDDLVNSVDFNSDGTTLAAASWDKDNSLTLWDMHLQSWIDNACQRAGRNFTPDEWALYFPNEEYRKTCAQWPLEGDAPTLLDQTSADQSLTGTDVQAPVQDPVVTEEPAGTEAPVVAELSAGNSQAAFVEEFDGNMDTWSTFMTSGIDRQVKTSFDGGNLNIKLVISEGKLPWAYWINDSSTYNNIQMEAVVTNNGNNSNGVNLICQYSDAGWYEFTVSNTGLYAIYAYDPNRLPEERYQQLIAGGSPAIQVGHTTNTYTAACQGSELSLSINGTLVNTFTDTRYNFTEGKIGFGASSPQILPIDLTFESISVSIPE